MTTTTNWISDKLDYYGQTISPDESFAFAQDKMGRIVSKGRDGFNKLEKEALFAWNMGMRVTCNVRNLDDQANILSTGNLMVIYAFSLLTRVYTQMSHSRVKSTHFIS